MEYIENYSITIFGGDQRAFSGDILPDSIGIHIINSVNYSDVKDYTVKFTVEKGGGDVNESLVKTDMYGNAYTFWTLGTLTNNQTVNAEIFKPNGKLINTMKINAQAFNISIWDTVTNGFEININDIANDTINHQTFILANNTVYKQDNPFYQWTNQNYSGSYLKSIKMNKAGIIYASSWYGDLYKSDNSNIYFVPCTKPDPNNFNYFEFSVTGTDHIWATTTYTDLQCSRDGGNSWTSSSSGIFSGQKLGKIIQHKDGTLFLLTLQNGLYKSVNDGQNWTPLSSIDYIVDFCITNDGDLIVYRNYNAFQLLKSTNKGLSFTECYKLENNWQYFSNFETFRQYKSKYYVTITGKGILETSDFETYTTFWDHPAVTRLFVTNDGTFIAKDDNYSNVYYRHLQ